MGAARVPVQGAGASKTPAGAATRRRRRPLLAVLVQARHDAGASLPQHFHPRLFSHIHSRQRHVHPWD